MPQITSNFHSIEFACRCNGKYPDCKGEGGIKGALVERLQNLRDDISQIERDPFAIRVLSGYRCPEHNKAQGGVPMSWHIHGLAADITSRVGLRALFIAAVRQGFTGIGINSHKNFIHVDIRPVSKPGYFQKWKYSPTGAQLPWSGKWEEL